MTGPLMTENLQTITTWLMLTQQDLNRRFGNMSRVPEHFAKAAEDVALSVWRYVASGYAYEQANALRWDLLGLQDEIEDLPGWDEDFATAEAAALVAVVENFFTMYDR